MVMISTDNLELMSSVMKPSIFNTIMKMDALLDEIELEDYDQAIISVINSPRDEPNQHALDIEDAYLSVGLELLKRMGVEYNTDTITLFATVSILDSLHSILSVDMNELYETLTDSSETGLELLINILVELTDMEIGYWLTILFDFDSSSLLNVKRIFKLDMTEDDIALQENTLNRVKAFISTNRDTCTIASSYIKNRPTSEAVGYSFFYAVNSIHSQLEYYTQLNGQANKIAIELTGLAMGSSLSIEDTPHEIYQALELFDISPLYITTIMGIVHRLLKNE